MRFIFLLYLIFIANISFASVFIVKPDASSDTTAIDVYSPLTLLGHDDLGQYTAWYRIQIAPTGSVASNSLSWKNVEIGGYQEFNVSSINAGNLVLTGYSSDWDTYHLTFKSMSTSDEKYISQGNGDRVEGYRGGKIVWTGNLDTIQTATDEIKIANLAGLFPAANDSIRIYRSVLWGNQIGLSDGDRTELGKSERLLPPAKLDSRYFVNGPGNYLIRFVVYTTCAHKFGDVNTATTVNKTGGSGFTNEQVLYINYLGEKNS